MEPVWLAVAVYSIFGFALCVIAVQQMVRDAMPSDRRLWNEQPLRLGLMVLLVGAVVMAVWPALLLAEALGRVSVWLFGKNR